MMQDTLTLLLIIHQDDDRALPCQASSGLTKKESRQQESDLRANFFCFPKVEQRFRIHGAFGRTIGAFVSVLFISNAAPRDDSYGSQAVEQNYVNLMAGVGVDE